MPSELEASVVVATHDRAARLGALLAALRAQTLPAERFEVIVVDDGSGDETGALLERETGRGGLQLRTLRLDPSARPRRRPPARVARGGRAGGRVHRRRLRARPGLARGRARRLRAAPGRDRPGANRADRRRARALRAVAAPVHPHDPGAGARPRLRDLQRLLSARAVGGGSAASTSRRTAGSTAARTRTSPGGRSPPERARRSLPEALVRHAVNRLGPLGKLRFAAGWELRAYADHPGLRRAHFSHLLFWKPSHYLLARALLGLALPRRARWLAPWLVTPYLRHLLGRGRVEGGGPLLAPYFALHDLIEMAAVARAALRYRTLML